MSSKHDMGGIGSEHGHRTTGTGGDDRGIGNDPPEE
jgi:hypothetical protein